MPAKNAPSEFDYPDFAEYELKHNPGVDFLRMLKWCAAADESAFRVVFATYSRSPIAILLGSAAIEGYLNYVGYMLLNDEWQLYTKGAKPFGDKLKHIFKSQSKSIDLGAGVYQEAVALLNFRGQLAHPRFNHTIEQRKGPTPTVFDHAEVDYPAVKTLDIVTRFKLELLSDLQVKDHWQSLKYGEILPSERGHNQSLERTAIAAFRPTPS